MKVKEIRLNKTAIEINWVTDYGTEVISMLYRHSDYSWHLDPDTRNLSPKVLEDLQKAVFKAVTAKPKSTRKRRRDTWFADDPRPGTR